MSKVTGRAKKHDGTAIDYVSIFNWSDGQCLGQVTPDASGNWDYQYFEDLTVGITYVADGCEPITHGAYNLVAESLVPTDTILHYTFNGHTNDNSGAALHGVPSGDLSFVAGRKDGSQAIKFAGGDIKTPRPLPINSDKLTVSFWFKTSQDDLATIMTADKTNNQNMLQIFSNSSSLKSMNVQDVSSTGAYTNKRSDSIPKGVWNHFIVTADRVKTRDAELNVFLNGQQVADVPDSNDDIQGNFGSHVLKLGINAVGVRPYIGLIQDFRVYSRVLSEEELLLLLHE